MRVVKLLLPAVVLAACLGARAQMPAPQTPELDKLAWMVGEWTADVDWTMPGMPASKAPMTFKVTREGMFYRATSVMEMEGMKFTEDGYIGWDAEKKKYGMWTFTNFAATPRIEWATYEKDVMVSVSEPWANPMGPALTSRATMTKKGEAIDFVLEFKEGDKWNKVAAGVFKKKN